MPSGGLLCPRWCITYKEGKSSGRHGCYGRAWYDEVQPTVSLASSSQQPVSSGDWQPLYGVFSQGGKLYWPFSHNLCALLYM